MNRSKLIELIWNIPTIYFEPKEAKPGNKSWLLDLNEDLVLEFVLQYECRHIQPVQKYSYEHDQPGPHEGFADFYETDREVFVWDGGKNILEDYQKRVQRSLTEAIEIQFV